MDVSTANQNKLRVEIKHPDLNMAWPEIYQEK